MWSIDPGAEGGYHLRRDWRGVADHHMIDAAFLASPEAPRLHSLATAESDSYIAEMKLGEKRVTRPSDLLAAVLESGRKGMAVDTAKKIAALDPADPLGLICLAAGGERGEA